MLTMSNLLHSPCIDASAAMQDLFSELAAPMPPQPLAAQPSGYMQQPGYGQVGQVYGHQAGGQAPGYMGPSPGSFPYQYAQPVPPGYQPYMLAAPAGPAPQQQSFPASGTSRQAFPKVLLNKPQQ